MRLVAVAVLIMLATLLSIVYAEPFFSKYVIAELSVAYPVNVPTGLPVEIYVYAKTDKPTFTRHDVAVYLECVGPEKVIAIKTLTFDELGEVLGSIEVTFPRPGIYRCTVRLGPYTSTGMVRATASLEAVITWALSRPNVAFTLLALLVGGYIGVRHVLPRALPYLADAVAYVLSSRRGSIRLLILTPRRRRRKKIVIVC